MLKETPEWHMGRRGEILQLAVLARFGFSVIDIGGSTNNNAPFLHKYDVNFVAPDALAFRSGPLWMEFKTKSHHTPWRGGSVRDNPRIPPRMEEGVDRRSFLAYQQVAKTTGVPVVLWVLSIKESELLANSLRNLGEPRPSPDPSYDLVSWDISKFRRVCEFDPKRLREYFVSKDGERRACPSDVPPPAALRKVLDYLNPSQREFDLLLLDFMAQLENSWREAG